MLTTPIPGVAGDQVHKSSAPLLGMASCPSPIHGVSILDEVTHQPESRTRENRLSGSEGGRAEHNRFSLPLSEGQAQISSVGVLEKLRGGISHNAAIDAEIL